MRKNDCFYAWRFSCRCAHSHWHPLFSHEALNVGEYHVRNSSRCVRALCTGETGHNKRPLSMFGMLWIGVYGSVFQFLPKSSNFAQPLKRSGPTFHRPQSTTWSTLWEGDVLHCVRQMAVTPDTDWFSDPPGPPQYSKTAHFRVAFYCGQPKEHLCSNHAV